MGAGGAGTGPDGYWINYGDVWTSWNGCHACADSFEACLERRGGASCVARIFLHMEGRLATKESMSRVCPIPYEDVCMSGDTGPGGPVSG